MKVVVASDKWRGSFGSREAGAALARGLARALTGAVVEIVEVADGGEGTVEAVLARASRGERRVTRVTGPRGSAVDAGWAILPAGCALIETAATAGHALLASGERDPLATTTRGVGELVRAALDVGRTEVALALGGSATVDGGAGMAQALGFRLLDRAGHDLPPGGGALGELERIDAAGADPRLSTARFEAWCDVTNPLLGPAGAARVFGPQKGATAEAVERLEAGLARFAEVAERDLGVAIAGVSSAERRAGSVAAPWRSWTRGWCSAPSGFSTRSASTRCSPAPRSSSPARAASTGPRCRASCHWWWRSTPRGSASRWCWRAART